MATILTDKQLRKIIEEKKGGITIEGYSSECVQPASYDFRLGKTAITPTHTFFEKDKSRDIESRMVNVEEEGKIEIQSGGYALVTTYEWVELSTKYVGRIGLTSTFTRQGLILLAGPQIDPGFKGPLILALYNISGRPIELQYLTSFCTVEFHRLEEECEKTYNKPQEGINKYLELYVKSMNTTSLHQLVDVVKELQKDVHNLKKEDRMKWLFFYVSIFALLVMIAALVVPTILALVK